MVSQRTCAPGPPGIAENSFLFRSADESRRVDEAYEKLNIPHVYWMVPFVDRTPLEQLNHFRATLGLDRSQNLVSSVIYQTEPLFYKKASPGVIGDKSKMKKRYGDEMEAVSGRKPSQIMADQSDNSDDDDDKSVHIAAPFTPPNRTIDIGFDKASTSSLDGRMSSDSEDDEAITPPFGQRLVDDFGGCLPVPLVYQQVCPHCKQYIPQEIAPVIATGPEYEAPRLDSWRGLLSPERLWRLRLMESMATL
ncbi:hypothetical protein GGR50DRAFT_696473 [Xylaria sp. CBS 124048]|nr:hypothetical protein GGR50DRAFT_696473 [Xylaria sp. CBS 124048]